MKILKESIGLDVSKVDFKCCHSQLEEDLSISVIKSDSFENDMKGVKKLVKYLKNIPNSSALQIVMEATGVYHELLAYKLVAEGFRVTILLPNKAKAFMKSINQRAKTDKIDARLLSQMGLERKLDQWMPPKEVYARLKSLTRERNSLVKEKSILKNKIHAVESSFLKDKRVLRRLKQRIKLLEKQIVEITNDINQVISDNQDIKEKVERIEKVKGLSNTTIITVIAETQGFNLIRNQKQLIGYAGLDVRQHQSGNVQRKGMLSKKGNKYIRKALFLPALSSCQSNDHLKLFYQQLNKRQASKKQGVLAVARKMLILIYTLWKNGQEYDPEKNIQNRLVLNTV